MKRLISLIAAFVLFVSCAAHAACPAFTPEDYPRIFAEQLEKTGAGYFDYYLLHDLTRNDIDIAENGGFDFVMARKAEGLVRHIGFSYHDDAVLLEEIL